MNLNSSSPSILMSTIVLLSLVSRISSWSSVSILAAAPHATQMRATRLPRRPEIEL